MTYLFQRNRTEFARNEFHLGFEDSARMDYSTQ